MAIDDVVQPQPSRFSIKNIIIGLAVSLLLMTALTFRLLIRESKLEKQVVEANGIVTKFRADNSSLRAVNSDLMKRVEAVKAQRAMPTVRKKASTKKKASARRR